MQINISKITEYINASQTIEEKQLITFISLDPWRLARTLVFIEFICAVNPTVRKEFLEGMMSCPDYIKDGEVRQ